MTEYGVVLLFTTSEVMRAEKVLKKQGLDTKLIPVPRRFSSDCGVSLRFLWVDLDRVKAALEAAGVETQAIHQL